MKTKTRINNATKVVVLGVIALVTTTFSVVAQQSRKELDELYIQKINSWKDSVESLKPKKMPIYVGGGISLSFPQYILKSNLQTLDQLSVNYIGTDLEGMIGSAIGKLKAKTGLYYSQPSVPFDMEMLKMSLSGSLYFLRLNKIKYHTFEPYAKLGIARQQTKFYGDYLTESGKPAPANYSSSEQPLLNVTQYYQANIGLGVEYQLENCKNLFIHLFAELNYSMQLFSKASNASFNKTSVSSPSAFSFGINFGKIK